MFGGISPQVLRVLSPHLAGNVPRFGQKSHQVWREISPGLTGNLTGFGRKSDLIWRESSRALAEISRVLAGILPRFGGKYHEVVQEIAQGLVGNLS